MRNSLSIQFPIAHFDSFPIFNFQFQTLNQRQRQSVTQKGSQAVSFIDKDIDSNNNNNNKMKAFNFLFLFLGELGALVRGKYLIYIEFIILSFFRTVVISN